MGILANPNPAAVRVLFDHYADYVGDNIVHFDHGYREWYVHTQAWPYPANDSVVGGIFYTMWRADAVTIPVTDLVPGTNTVQIGANQPLAVSNVDIVLVNVPGGVPVLPGSNNTYP